MPSNSTESPEELVCMFSSTSFHILLLWKHTCHVVDPNIAQGFLVSARGKGRLDRRPEAFANSEVIWLRYRSSLTALSYALPADFVTEWLHDW